MSGSSIDDLTGLPNNVLSGDSSFANSGATGGSSTPSNAQVVSALQALAKGASAMGPQNQNIPQPAVPNGSPLGQPHGSLDAITQLLMNRANTYGPPGLLGAVR